MSQTQLHYSCEMCIPEPLRLVQLLFVLYMISFDKLDRL